LKNHVRNIEFHEATKSYVAVAMRLIVSFLQRGEQVRFMITEKNEIEQNGACRTTYVEQPLFFEMKSRHLEEFKNLPEHQACMKVIMSDPIIARHVDCLVGTWNSRMRRTAEDYLDYLLWKQFPQGQEKIEFSPETFEQGYKALESLFYNDTIALKVFVPLHNFESDASDIDLGNNLHIRRISKNETEQLLDESSWSSFMPRFEVLNFKYAIELAYSAKKAFGDIPQQPALSKEQEVSGTIGKLVTALRLFKRGLVGFNIIKTLSASEQPIPLGMYRFSSPYKSFLGEQYSLTGPEVNDFKEFWDTIKRIDLEGHATLNIALRRFNYAYERNNPEDKLIDFMVAFEALFFKEGESEEFRNRLSIRVSRFLEREFEQRKLLAKKMKGFYDARSKVVHGEKVQLKDDFVKAVEDFLRRSTKLFLESLKTSNSDDILTHLDLD
jgi:hypothetical protein